jgi:hypothetical protein
MRKADRLTAALGFTESFAWVDGSRSGVIGSLV